MIINSALQLALWIGLLFLYSLVVSKCALSKKKTFVNKIMESDIAYCIFTCVVGLIPISLWLGFLSCAIDGFTYEHMLKSINASLAWFVLFLPFAFWPIIKSHWTAIYGILCLLVGIFAYYGCCAVGEILGDYGILSRTSIVYICLGICVAYIVMHQKYKEHKRRKVELLLGEVLKEIQVLTGPDKAELVSIKLKYHNEIAKL